MTGEIAVQRNTNHENLQMHLWVGGNAWTGGLHIGAVCSGIGWVEVEGEC